MIENNDVFEIKVDDATTTNYDMVKMLTGYQYGLGANSVSKIPIKDMTTAIFPSDPDADKKLSDTERAKKWEVSKAAFQELLFKALADDPLILCKIAAIVLKPVGKEWHDELYDPQIQLMKKVDISILNKAFVFFLTCDDSTPAVLVNYLKQVLATNTNQKPASTAKK